MPTYPTTKPTTVDYFRVPHPLWRKVKPLLPKVLQRRRPARPPADTRAVLNGIWYVLWTGCQWKAIHRDWFGVASSVLHEHFQTWQRNQRQLYEELTWYFDTPPLPCERAWQSTHIVGKATVALKDGSSSVLMIWTGMSAGLACNRCSNEPANGRTLKSGVSSTAVTYALTSLTPREASVEHLAASGVDIGPLKTGCIMCGM